MFCSLLMGWGLIQDKGISFQVHRGVKGKRRGKQESGGKTLNRGLTLACCVNRKRERERERGVN